LPVEAADRPVTSKVAAEDPETPKVPPRDLVVLQSAAERSVLAADQATDLILRIRLSAESIPTIERPAINLALVVDTSGSMKGEPIEKARQACATIVDKLQKGDRLSVVAFGSKAQVLVPSTLLDGENVADMKAKLESMSAKGTTNMSDGLARGLAEAQKGILPGAINRIVLLGDGVPNDAARTLGQANVAQARGVPITSLGLGADFDETLMNQVAQRSGGSFHFIDEPDRVSKVFEKEVTRLERVVAKNGFLDITPGPGVTIHRALGLPGSKLGRKLRLQIGQLSEGQQRDVMIHVSVGAHHDGATIELADAWSRELSDFVALRASKNEDDLKEGRNAAVEHAALRIKVADMFVRAIALARGSDVQGARKLLREAEKIAKLGAKQFDDEELKKKVGEARELHKTVAKLAPRPVQPRWRSGFGMSRGVGQPTPGMAPAPMPKPQALGLRRVHGAALDDINGRY
jgi:Ca-activated chloride channel family protein